jgi:hypothetical protein
MKTIRVSLGLSKLKPSEKVTLWGTIKGDMTGNSNFTTPNPALATIDAQVVIFGNDIVAAAGGDHAAITAMHTQEDKVDSLLEQLANYVELTANAAALTGGDATTIITGAGMKVGAEHTKAPVPNAPTDLKGTSLVEGEIELSWKNQKYARAFIVEISSDLTATGGATGTTTTGSTTARVYVDWDIIDVCHKPSIVLSGLVSGTKYAVRVLSSGTAGKSAASSVVVVKVL